MRDTEGDAKGARRRGPRLPEPADTKQWYLINDDKCCIQARFLTILPYCFGGSLPLNTEISRR